MIPATPVPFLTLRASEAIGLLKEGNTPVFIYEFHVHLKIKFINLPENSAILSFPNFSQNLQLLIIWIMTDIWLRPS